MTILKVALGVFLGIWLFIFVLAFPELIGEWREWRKWRKEWRRVEKLTKTREYKVERAWDLSERGLTGSAVSLLRGDPPPFHPTLFHKVLVIAGVVGFLALMIFGPPR
jgi:hypothetical protein